MRERDIIPSTLKGLWRWTQLIDCRNRVALCKRDDRKLLVKDFKLKPIKRRGKIPFRQFKTQLDFQRTMSSQATNNYMTVPTSPNLYITRKLNNMNKAKIFKKEHEDWTKLYCKMLKGLKTMIDVQRQIWDMMKIAKETNTTVMEMEETILKASINNRTMNVTNIFGISENLQYLIQSNMEDWVYQI